MNATYRRFALYFFLLCSSVVQLHAQSDSIQQSHPLITSMSMEAFQQRVKDLGFLTERESADGKPATFFTFRAEGRKIGGMVMNPETLELFVAFSDNTALETTNEWNRSHIDCSAVVDQRGGTFMRSDLVLTGGVAPENIDNFIKRFRDMAVAYARFIVDHKSKVPTAPAPPAP